MANRRDLIQAFQFAARRVVSAAVMRQTDPTEWPYRRLGGAGFGAIMMTVIALGAVGVYGLIEPGGKTSWQSGGTVIVVKESGASYVYMKGELHPVLNFTSATLLAGSNQITMTSKSSLVGYKRGVELGIPGAPETLPADGDLVMPPWSLCTQQAPNSQGKLVSRTRLVVSKSPNQGTAPGDQALLAVDNGNPEKPVDDGMKYLVWHDHAYPLTDWNDDRVALHLDNDVHLNVGSAWLRALPAGESIGKLTATGDGAASTAVPGASGLHAGDVLSVQTQDKGTQYYLVNQGSLTPISQMQYQIQVAAGANSQTITSDQAAAANTTPPPATVAQQAPVTVPSFVRPNDSNTVLCAAYANNGSTAKVLVDSAIPENGGLPTVGTTNNGTPLADRVWVPPGKAALVEAMPSPTSPDGTLYLVNDEGKRFAIPSSDVLRSIGLTGVHLTKLPTSLVTRIPEGPALDPDAAQAALAEEQADQ